LDLSIADDKSISRNHAELELLHSGEVVVRDFGSRYGTFVNGSRLVPQESTHVSQNSESVVKFGANNTQLKIYKAFYNVCVTQLDKQDKDCLKVK
jgi:pSer/pThr/pTyr-binding forkhead associated (FHA) protein